MTRGEWMDRMRTAFEDADATARDTVDPRAHASRSRNSPFGGMELPGRVVATFLRGTPTVLDRKLA